MELAFYEAAGQVMISGLYLEEFIRLGMERLSCSLVLHIAIDFIVFSRI
jgi:hypothetical protein